MTRRHCLLFWVALFACESEPPASKACPGVDIVSEPLTGKCWPKPLEPDTDPTSPNYGRVNCVMIAEYLSGADECACDMPGFAPATPEQIEFARAILDGYCGEACCGSVCYCEFLQHEGDALAACQSRTSTGTYSGEPSGWCYVEPALGLGSEEDVAKCPAAQKSRLKFLPEDPRYNIFATFACIGTP